jgi:hypothetical protein
MPLLGGLLVAPVSAQGINGRASDSRSFEIRPLLAEKFADMSLPVPTPARLVVCHGFGCRSHTEIGLGKADNTRLAQLMLAGRTSPAAERKSIAQAVAWFGRRVGPEAGTTKAIARPNLKFPGGDPGQFDCVDTSTNTTALFYVMDTLHLFYHHHLALPVSRHFLLDGAGPHITAVLTENLTGQRWAFDPWTHNNGELPDVLPVESWISQD